MTKYRTRWPALRDLAWTDPDLALGRLAWALMTSAQWRTDCAKSPEHIGFGQSRPSLESLQTQYGRAALPDTLALILLAALDAHLYVQRAGQHATPVFDPPAGQGEAGIWTIPRMRSPSPAPVVEHPDQVLHYLRHHQVVPTESRDGVQIQVIPPEGSRDEAAGRSSVAVCSFAEDVAFVRAPVKEPSFQFTDLDDGNGQRRGAAMQFAGTLQQQALLAVVLPELSLSSRAQEAFRDACVRGAENGGGPALILPGSFHEVDREGVCRHVARLYNSQGTQVLEHHKIRLLSHTEAREAVTAGNTLSLLMGPWGLLAVGICRDFLDIDADFWADALPDVVLIPTMGTKTTMSAHRDKARQLGIRCAPTIAIANQPPPGKPCACRGMIQTPDRELAELTADASSSAPYFFHCSDLSI